MAASLNEAYVRFVSERKTGNKSTEGYQDLGKFVNYFGKDRDVSEILPSEVAEYAQYIGRTVSDPAKRLASVKLFLVYMRKEEIIETSLATHLRIPRTRASASKRAAAQAEGTALSEEGFKMLNDQLAALKGERVSVVADIKRAMEDKDFRENAPLDAAKERQGFVESRIRELESSLNGATILSGKGQKSRKVSIGSKVTVRDLGTGKKATFSLVDVREADLSLGKLSTVSPVGHALMDTLVGDEISVSVPRGNISYKIEKIIS
jgi:transcription elongation factor GreA